jgi:hypothetical protein
VRKGLIVAGVAVVAYFVWTKRASAATKQPGFGEPGFVAPATPALPVTVIGCSFARAGNQLLDANTGKVIREEEAQRRAKAEGCTVPPLPAKATKPGQSIFASGGK